MATRAATVLNKRETRDDELIDIEDLAFEYDDSYDAGYNLMVELNLGAALEHDLARETRDPDGSYRACSAKEIQDAVTEFCAKWAISRDTLVDNLSRPSWVPTAWPWDE